MLDGGRPDYIFNRLHELPNIRSLMSKARWYHNAWVGSLMSITPPDHAVIGTGSLPRNDGGLVNWEWGMHNTGTISPSLQDLSNYDNDWAFKLIRESGTPTLAGEIRKKYPNDPVIAGSAAHFHAAGPLGGPDASWIFWYQRHKGEWIPRQLGPNTVPAELLNDPSLRTGIPSSTDSTVPQFYSPLMLGKQDSLVIDFAIAALHKYRPRGILLNLPEIDAIGHWSLQWKRDEGILHRSFDNALGRLLAAYQKAGIYDKTLFVITADHGMIQSTHRVLDREAVIKQIRDTLGEKSIILTNGGGGGGPTMTSIWLKDPAHSERMAQLIWDKHYDNLSAIYYRNGSDYHQIGVEDSFPDLVKAYDYLLSTEGAHGEDIAILLRENARNSGLPRMLGRHGGADWGSQQVTLMLSGPGVKVGTSKAPARLVDIAPTIERLMGMKPNARDGVVLADAFQQPHPDDVAPFKAAAVKFAPMVAALQKRAARDTKLAGEGKLPNFIPADEIIIHWKRRLAVTAVGAAVLVGTGAALVWAVKVVRRQGTGLKWTD
ncbi:MAG: alkaline phosphatase family protein [Chloroflexota bacterium]